MSPPPSAARWWGKDARPDPRERDPADERGDAIARQEQTDLELVQSEPRDRHGAEVREAAPEEEPFESHDPVEDPRGPPPEHETVVEALAGHPRRLPARLRAEKADRGQEGQAADADVEDPPGDEVRHRPADRRREALGERGDGREASQRRLTPRVGHRFPDVGKRERNHGRREDPRDEAHRAEPRHVLRLSGEERPDAEADRRPAHDPHRAEPVAEGPIEELAEAVRQHVERHCQAHRGHAGPKRLRDGWKERGDHPDVDLDEKPERDEERKRTEPCGSPRRAEAHPIETGRRDGRSGKAAVAPSTGRVRTPLIRHCPCSSTTS